MKTKEPISEETYASDLYDAGDLDSVMATVKDVFTTAQELRGNTHEATWASKVVGPLLIRVAQLAQFHADDKAQIEDVNITTVGIAPHSLCPTSPTEAFNDADKRVDFALALKLSDAERDVLNAGRYQVEGPGSINQTLSPTSYQKPMFSYYEVKMDNRDPMVQLGAWITAEFLKRFREGWPMNLPVPAIEIDKDNWLLWIAVAVRRKPATEGGMPFKVQFTGSWAMGSTRSITGIFQILHALKAIARWGVEVYKPAFRKGVLSKVQKSSKVKS
ncbi:MAG: hypothetical protein Q9222_002207 [Ikaeria aurantiellina]